MGRVRRYKKFKACDPFAKKRPSTAPITSDEPPEDFEARARRAKKKRSVNWEDPIQRDLLVQREALRAFKHSQTVAATEGSNKATKLLPKQENESMKSFQKRIKEETRATLHEEVHKMTATAQKRKLRLKERKAHRKKGKGTTSSPQILTMEDEEIGGAIRKKRRNEAGGRYNEEDKDDGPAPFYSAEDGRIRPSDYGEASTMEFPQADKQSFGERVTRPPDLKAYSMKLDALKKKFYASRGAETPVSAVGGETMMAKATGFVPGNNDYNITSSSNNNRSSDRSGSRYSKMINRLDNSIAAEVTTVTADRRAMKDRLDREKRSALLSSIASLQSTESMRSSIFNEYDFAMSSKSRKTKKRKASD